MRRSRHCPGQCGQLDLGDVEPRPVFAGVVDLQALGESECLVRCEGLVERGDAVGVEIVHDQHHGLGVGIVRGQQLFDLPGPVDLGSLGQGVHTAPPVKGLGPHEDRAGAAPDVFAVLAGVLSWPGGKRVADMAEGRAAGHRPPARPPCGWRTPRSLAARCSSTSSDEDAVPFFEDPADGGVIQVWDVLGELTCFSSSRNDHRAYPDGGCEQASAISRASTSPVAGDGTGGRSRFVREIVARTSPPLSVNRLAPSGSISPETPSRSAITSSGSGSPTEVSSASSTLCPPDRRCRMHTRGGQPDQLFAIPRRQRDRPLHQ